MNNSYDAILYLSFGGPESMEDVMPFLRNVTKGRQVPEERLLEVAKHYELFDGVSPINEQNRDIIRRLDNVLKAENINLPVFFGNRNWHPMLTDTVKDMQSKGVKKALAFVSSAYSSYSSCRQYLDDIESAQTALGASAPQIDKIRPFFNHPLFIAANAENLKNSLASIPAEIRAELRLAFTAHSIPLSMASSCQYSNQLEQTCQLLAKEAGLASESWQLVYQSRSGPPSIPWLEPDILEHIRALHAQGVRHLLIHPVGFISDHMEVIYDLDHEAKLLCDELGIYMKRVPSASCSDKFIEMIIDLINERINGSSTRASIGDLDTIADQCPESCCPPAAARPSHSRESSAKT